MPDDPSRMHYFQDLELQHVLSDCWKLLCHAVTDRACGWRLPVVATHGPEGVCQRTVVLRAVNAVQRQVLFHTDRRSAKIRQIQADARTSILFYDQTRSVQLRLQGMAGIHCEDELADTVWNLSPPESLRAYPGPLAPGTITDQPWTNLPQHLQNRIPERCELEEGRQHFAVIVITVEQLDWLLLARAGNLRARFRYLPTNAADSAEASFTSEWLSP